MAPVKGRAALRKETERKSSELLSQLEDIYKREIEPFASILADHETRLLDTKFCVIHQLIWSTDTEAADELVDIALDLVQARSEAVSIQATTGDDRPAQLDRLRSSLCWFVGSIDERRRLGIAPPEDLNTSQSISALVAELAAHYTQNS